MCHAIRQVVEFEVQYQSEPAGHVQELLEELGHLFGEQVELLCAHSQPLAQSDGLSRCIGHHRRTLTVRAY